MIWTKAFWKGAAERAIKTFAQVFVAALMLSTGTELIPAVGIEGIPWLAVFSLAILATVVSLLTSIGNADFTAGTAAAEVIEGELVEAKYAVTDGAVPDIPDDPDFSDEEALLALADGTVSAGVST